MKDTVHFNYLEHNNLRYVIEIIKIHPYNCDGCYQKDNKIECGNNFRIPIFIYNIIQTLVLLFRKYHKINKIDQLNDIKNIFKDIINIETTYNSLKNLKPKIQLADLLDKYQFDDFYFNKYAIYVDNDEHVPYISVYADQYLLKMLL